MKKGTKIILLLIAVLIIAAIARSIVKNQARAAELRPFAQCLSEKGVKFYGAYWCPHCAAQKRLFGSVAKDLPYVECATSDGKGQTEACTAAGIQSYPTWTLSDGTRLTGEQSFEELAAVSGCTAPAL